MRCVGARLGDFVTRRRPVARQRALLAALLLVGAVACAPAAQPEAEPQAEPAPVDRADAMRADRALLAQLPATTPPPRRVGPIERRDPFPPSFDAGPTGLARADGTRTQRTMLAAVDGRAIRINVGGPEVTAGGLLWLEDRYVETAGATFGNESLEDIGGTDADAIYRSERNTGADAEGAHFRYVVPVPDGSYRVVLHFAEIYFGTPGNPEAAPGQRVFDVELEGELVLQDYDVVAAAGGAARAVWESFEIVVDDGSLVLTVRNGAANRGKLSALEILPLDAGG